MDHPPVVTSHVLVLDVIPSICTLIMLRSSRSGGNSWLLPVVLSTAGASACAVALFLRRTSYRSKETAEAQSLEVDATARLPVSELQIRDSKSCILKRGSVTIVHGSVTGTCARFAADLYEAIRLQGVTCVELGCIEDWDWWDELLNDDEDQGEGYSDEPATLIILLPTYTNGTWTPASSALQGALQELTNDWRVAKFPLKRKLHVSVFGTGSSEYLENGISNMGQPAKECLKAFQSLGAKIITKLRVGDDASGDHARESFEAWKQEIIQNIVTKNPDVKACSCVNSENKEKESCCKQDNAVETDAADSYFEDDDESEEEETGEPDIIDMEDMGDAILASTDNESAEPREMVTPSQAAALKKEGYKLIGTHSAVKLCRWTKHQLRGRGGCYKHTFYGITSYQCMEATPSLACANKCVFCWRHHKNPVGKEWRWKTDDPRFIVDEAVQTHVQMIKETRGIPGVRLDRWKEAHTVRHCALSLVGEPIMYPRIDELLAELHRRKISTFLVTNGQHPNAIASLRPITQLYVSVDAPTPESLIAIDRPLFNDAWDRLRLSLSSLKDKEQRTVARLTVVKGWNSEEVAGYADLIALGKVSLVEVKGVTFCGKSDASNLNMSNTPWHHEVVDLTRTLKHELAKLRTKDNSIPEYDFACEHKHSCSVLLARVDQFAFDDPSTGMRKWRTWIDYDKFQKLAARYSEDPSCTFTVNDYTAETPEWALFGSEEEGFDPTDQRHRKNTKHPKYTQFDKDGVPTHDENNQELSTKERQRLANLMNERKRQLGEGSVITELKGGAKEVHDASLMFRGLVVAK